MLPVTLDLARLPTLLLGPAAAVQLRAGQLRAAGAQQLSAWVCEASVPSEVPSLEQCRLLMVCAREMPGAEALLSAARERGILVWMEDRREFCDFHLPACVRRGDLTISISTGGRSPALARHLRRQLEALFPAAWAERLEEIGTLRDRLRERGADASVINAATEQFLDERGWS